jgi:hypothetical protein
MINALAKLVVVVESLEVGRVQFYRARAELEPWLEAFRALRALRSSLIGEVLYNYLSSYYLFEFFLFHQIM